jgi:hypothetical protein
VLDLITVQFLFKYGTKPIYLFGKAAIASIALSFAGFGWATWLKFWGDKTYIETPLPLLTTMLFMLGVTFVLMGLLAELMVRTYHEAQGKATYTVRSVAREGAVHDVEVGTSGFAATTPREPLIYAADPRD